jgi:hypothetical protein
MAGAVLLWHNGLMPNSVAIVVSGLVIAIAILFSARWQIVATNAQILRLDSWTGKVAACNTPDRLPNLAWLPAGLDISCEKQ